MTKENLIYLKKKMYYLLINANPKDMLDSEKGLLALLEDDIELSAEIEYKQYMEGE